MLYHHLNFVGDFSNEITQLISQQLELSGQSSPYDNTAQLQVRSQTLEEFKQSLSSSESNCDSSVLSLVLAADNIILNASDCEGENTFFIACNQGSQADMSSTIERAFTNCPGVKTSRSVSQWYIRLSRLVHPAITTPTGVSLAMAMVSHMT